MEPLLRGVEVISLPRPGVLLFQLLEALGLVKTQPPELLTPAVVVCSVMLSLRATSAVVCPWASAISASRSLRMICSGVCCFRPIPSPLSLIPDPITHFRSGPISGGQVNATNPFAVWAARRFFALPYYRAKISVVSSGDGIQYRCTRRASGRPVRFSAEYGPTSKVYEAKPGSLEYFLTERYCLYAQAKNGRVLRTEIHHVPWPLQEARANIEINELHVPHGFQISGPPSTLHFARRLDVVVWRPEVVEP